jgi:hypothetical protein
MSHDFQNGSLHNLLDRMHAGEREAQNELIFRIGVHLELLCKMLNRFGRLRSFEETGDVMTNACWRLLRSLESLKANTHEFFALAAEQERSELLDLAKPPRCQSPRRR